MTYFAGLGMYGLGLGTFYWFWTYEVAGSTLLWSFGLMPLIVVVWAWRRGAMRERLPEDDPGTVAGEHGGPIGTFPAATAWPLFLVISVIVTGAALIYGAILLTVGLSLMMWAILGLTRESDH